MAKNEESVTKMTVGSQLLLKLSGAGVDGLECGWVRSRGFCGQVCGTDSTTILYAPKCWTQNGSLVLHVVSSHQFVHITLCD